MRVARLAAPALLAWALAAESAQGACRQALALGLDVSGSVDSGEYLLQMRGLANALRHPDVRAALLAQPASPVEIAVFEWSGESYQRLIADWTVIHDSDALERLSATLETTARRPAPPVTALGRAMAFGAILLARRPACWKRTLDISGDGRNNSGPRPEQVRAGLSGQRITLNALVIGSDGADDGTARHSGIGELSAYFRANVILGPDAFVETALGFADYEAAMVRKLKRELESVAVSALR